ncbi:hypothetical protein RAS12_13250 [Achromobacter seleniivolatilans]|uniref:Tail fiber protein n=1 Tax=Achromobacter seleniivolatilans TaxID=3047478 RepID=A0ABY9M8J8_9BURK|nr:hypothetical protein [Achromobacter sp. R39]WMD23291.1 hypothetical protein RAS12_13250 [Achromobacter sp. R39]
MATRIYKTPFAATGDKESLATADQPDGKVSLQSGWTTDYELPNDNANYRPIGRAEMNGIIGEVTEGLGDIQLNGFATWQAIDGGWPLGAQVASGGAVYRSDIDNNTTTPGAVGANWTPMGSGLATTAQARALANASALISPKTLGEASTVFSPVVGSASGVRMSVLAASAAASLTAGQVTVGVGTTGQAYRLSALNLPINLSSVGAGGMDTGLAPVSGYVALYVIFNPATGTAALLAVNATATAAPEVYGGANMPAGFTASALLSVWPTNASRQFVVGFQQGRQVSIEVQGVLSSSTQRPTATSLSIAGAVPLNAKAVSGYIALSSSTPTAGSSSVATSGSVGVQLFNPQISVAATAYSAPYSNVQLQTPQTIFYTATVTAGTMTAYIGITGYAF